MCIPHHWHLYDTRHTYSTLWVDHVYPTSLTPIWHRSYLLYFVSWSCVSHIIDTYMTPVILTLLCELIMCIPHHWHLYDTGHTYSTLWVDHVYPHIIDPYMTPVILTLLCELIMCILTSLTPIWHRSYLLYLVSWSCVSPHHWHLYDTRHTYSTLWVDHVYPHIIDPYMTPVILTLLCELIMCIPTSLTPIWHRSYLLYLVSWSCVSPHHWHLYDTRHTYSTLWVDHVYPHIIDICHTYSTLWVDHVYPHIIDTYMTPVILTLLCELIMCIPTSLTPIWHRSYLLYFVSWSCVSPHHWHLYDTRHTYSTFWVDHVYPHIIDICHTYSTLWVDHVYPHIIDTYMTPVILTLLCELIMCIPTSLTPIWHRSYLLYFVSWSCVSPHHWHLYDTRHTYSTLWVDHVYPHIIDTYMTPVILTLLCELIMCIPTSLTPIWHRSYLLYLVSWSCVSPHHWHLYDTRHTYSTLWVDHVYPHIIDICHTYSTLWVDHVYPHIIDTYMTPVILTLLCELIMCIPTSLTPIWHPSYLLYFVSWSCVSSHHWPLYDTCHTYSTLWVDHVYPHIIDTYMTPIILTLLCELIMCIPTSLTPIILTLLCELIMCILTSLTPIWHLSHLLYFVSWSCVSPHHWHLYDTGHTYSTLWVDHMYPHIIDTYMTPVILTLLCELIMCIPTSLTPIWHPSYLLYFVSWSCVSPHHWHLYDTCHTYSTLWVDHVYPHIIDTYMTPVILTLLCELIMCIPTSLTPIWHPSYLLYFVSWSCVSSHHWPLYDTCHTYSTLWVDHVYPHIIDTYMTPIILTLLCELIMCIPTSLTPIWHLSYLLYFVSWSCVSHIIDTYMTPVTLTLLCELIMCIPTSLTPIWHRSYLLYFVSWSCVSSHHWPLYDTGHTYSTLWVDHVYSHIIDTYMTPVILTLLCELIRCIPTSLTPIWHPSYLLYFVSWSDVSPHHWHLYDTGHTYSTLWVDHVYSHIIDTCLTPVILTLLWELIMCIPTSLTPIWHPSYLLYFVSWSCVFPHHWHLYDTCHTYSTLWVDHVYPTSLTPIWHLSYLLYFVSWSCVFPHHWHPSYLLYFVWVDHVYPHIIDTYMTPVILTLLCELIMCIPTSLTPIWHPSYLLYFVSWSCVSPHHWHLSYLLYFVSWLCVSPHHWPLYDTCHTYSTLWVDHVYPHIIDTYMTPVILTLLCELIMCIPTSLTPMWHLSYLLYFVSWSCVSPHHWHLYDTGHTYSTLWVDHVYSHIIDTCLTPVILTLLWELIMCIPTSLTPIWHPSYLLYFVSWSCVFPHHWHLYDTCHTYSTLWVDHVYPTSLTPIWHLSYLLYFVSWSCVFPHHWHPSYLLYFVWVDHVYPHIIDTYMTPVILTLLCELIMCIPTSLTPIWHPSYLLYFVSWSCVSPHHWHLSYLLYFVSWLCVSPHHWPLYDTCHTYSTLWVDHVYPHIIDTYMTPVILTLLCELIMCIPTSLTPMWHLSYLLYFVSWSCVSPHHWPLYDTRHTYSTLWVDHVYPHIIDPYMTPVILVLLCELIMCILTSLTPIWHPSYLLYFVSWSCVSHIIDTYMTPVTLTLLCELIMCIPTSLTPIWHRSYLLYFVSWSCVSSHHWHLYDTGHTYSTLWVDHVYSHIIDTYMTPVILTLLCELIMCIPTSLTPIWHRSYLLYFVSWSCVSPHHWHLYDTGHTYSTLWVDHVYSTSLTPIWHPSYLLYFVSWSCVSPHHWHLYDTHHTYSTLWVDHVYPHIIDTYMTPVILTLLCELIMCIPHHWHLYDTCHTYSTLWVDHVYPHIIDTYMTPVILTLLCELIMCILTSLTPIWHLSYLLYFVSWSCVSPHHWHLYDTRHTYSTLWVDHVYSHIIDTYMTPVILTLLCELIMCIPHHWHLYDTCHTYSTLWVDHVYSHIIDTHHTYSTLCELIMCIPTSLTPIWHLSYLLYFVSWSCVFPHHWHLYDTRHTYSTLWVDHVYPHIIDTYVTPVILTLLCELIMCIPTSLTPIWHRSYLLYFVSWSCVFPHHWHLYDTRHTYSTLWVDHVYPHIIDPYMTPVILTLLCELIMCIPTSLTPIWHLSYLLYFVSWSCVSPHHWHLYDTGHTYSTLWVDHVYPTSLTPIWHLSHLLYFVSWSCVSPHHWHLYDTGHTYSTLWVDHVYPHIIDTYHTYSTLWVDHVYSHIIDTYMTPVILTLLCELIMCIPTSLTPIWHRSYLLYFVSWSCVFPHHWHLYDTRHTYSTLWVDHVYPHIIDPYMTPVILTLLCELIMCIPTSLTPIWHPSYLLYFVSWSCVSPHHWHLYDTCHTYSTLWVDHVYPTSLTPIWHLSHLLYFVSWSCVSPHHWHLYDNGHTYSTLWVDHVYPQIIDPYMTPVILTLLCELIMCIPTSLTPIWHLSYLLYFVSWSAVSPHDWHLYDTRHTYSTLWVDQMYPHIIDPYMTPVILTLLCELIMCIPTSLTPVWHLSYLLYFVSWSCVSPHHWHLYDTRHTYSTLWVDHVYSHIIDTYMTPVILTLLCELIMCIPHHWHLYDTCHTYSTLWVDHVYSHIIDTHHTYSTLCELIMCIPTSLTSVILTLLCELIMCILTSLTPIWHLSYLLYFVSWSCVSPHHWHLYDTRHTYSTLWVDHVYPHIIDTYVTPVILTLLCELIMCIPTSLTPIWHRSYLLYFVSWSCVSPHHWHLYDTRHTYSTLWVDHVYPHIIDTYVTPVILTLLCELIMCIPTSLTPIWHRSYLLYFVSWSCVSPHHWPLYDTGHTYSTLWVDHVYPHIIDTYMTPVILTLLCELIMCIPTSLTPIWHRSYLLYFVSWSCVSPHHWHLYDTRHTYSTLWVDHVYPHIIDTYMTPVILTLLCELIMCIPTSLTPIWHRSYLLYFVSWSCVSPHHWHLCDTCHTYSTLWVDHVYPHIIDPYMTPVILTLLCELIMCIPTSLTPIWHLSYLLYFVSWSCVSPHHWHLYDTCHTYSTLWVDHVYPHIIDTYMTPVILTLLCELIMCIPTSLTPIWHLSYLLSFVSWSYVSPHHWHLYDTCHTYSTLWVDHVYPHIIDTYMTPVILTLLCELIMCIPTSLTPIWHRSYLLYFVSWSCVSPHHWHLYDTRHTYSTLWVDHVYPHIIDTYMTPVILTLLCELIMCIPTSLTPIWHPSYLLYFVSWSCVSPHHWHLYDTGHTYSTLWVDHVYPHIIDTYMTPVILTLLCELIMCIPTSLTPIWHRSYLLYFVSWSCVSPHHWHLYDTGHTYSTLWVDHVYPHIIDTYMTPVILTLLCELIMCIPTSLTPIWHRSYLLYFVSWSCVSPHHWHLSYLLYFVSWSCVSPHHWHLYDTRHTYSTLWVDHVYPHIIDTYMTPVILTLLCELIMCIPTSLTPIWHPSYLLYFVSWSCVSPHHWHLYDTHHTYSTLWVDHVYPHIIDTYMTPVILTLLCELIMCIPTSLTPIWHPSYLLYFVSWSCVSPHHWHLYDMLSVTHFPTIILTVSTYYIIIDNLLIILYKERQLLLLKEILFCFISSI